jgi:hypothetical protein
VEPWILPLIVLALITTAGYFWGRKKNRWIGAWIARECQAALRPSDTNYVNIGGSIGYHFTYRLAPPLTEAKGSFALLPRQSILYLPLSRLIRGHDRFYLQLYTDQPMRGEAHILREDYYEKDPDRISGADRMRRERVVAGDRAYVLLWMHAGLDRRLKRLLDRLGDGRADLLHFCAYPGNRNFYFYVSPVRGRLERLLQNAVAELPGLLLGGGGHGCEDAGSD